MSEAAQAVRIHPADNVVVAVRTLAAGCEFTIDGEPIVLRENVAAHRLFAAISDRLTTTYEGGVEELVAELADAA